MNSLRKSSFALYLIGSLVFASIYSGKLFAHGGAHDHDPNVKALPAEDKNRDISEAALQSMHDDYKQNIEPIFRKKCFDCHSLRTEFPWYYKVPGIRQWIDHEIREAREHLDMSAGFPFRSKYSIDHDLEEMDEVLAKATMPPKAYVFVHPEAKLSESEKSALREWIRKSRKALQSKGDTRH